MDQTYASFQDFFPRYCAEHSRPLTRWLHFGGTHLGGAVLAAALLRRQPALLAGVPVASYGTAWVAHALVERNRPATFSHPLWSLRGDVTMIAMMWRGRDAEVQRLAMQERTRRGLPPVPSAARSAA